MGGTEKNDASAEDENEKKEKVNHEKAEKEKGHKDEDSTKSKDKDKKTKKDKEEKKKDKNPQDKKDPTKLKAKLEKIEAKMRDLQMKKDEILKLICDAETNNSNVANPDVASA